MKRQKITSIRESFPDDPLKWNCMEVTDFLMDAASHLGMNYGQSRFILPYDQRTDCPVFDIECRFPVGHTEHSILAAVHICDHLAWLHNWLQPHFDQFPNG